MINVNYRKAPEHKAPSGIDDGYAAVKWVIAMADKMGIDKTRIGIMGESGGAYIVAGVSMRMAEKDEGKLVKWQAQLIPMTTNKWYTEIKEEERDEKMKGIYD